jgi:hypothetical protein
MHCFTTQQSTSVVKGITWPNYHGDWGTYPLTLHTSGPAMYVLVQNSAVRPET